MSLPPAVEIVAFALLSAVALGGALGMTTTMSMFRSAIFLMASFVGVAGLFILLGAELLGMLQVMMYLGGMLVMALFMVLFSGDPGGEKMATAMQLPAVERFFSRGLAREGSRQSGRGDGSMFTPIKRPAALLAAVVGGGLVALIAIRDPWPEAPPPAQTSSASRIGHLLMGKYMIAFEGAGLLILLGIFGAAWLARAGSHPDPTERARLRAAVDEPPPPIAGDREEGGG